MSFRQAQIGLRCALLSIISALACLGCEEGSLPFSPAQDLEASEVVLELPDVPVTDTSQVDEEVSSPSKAVLILDQAMRHPLSWDLTRGHLESLGYDVTYRRWYPHVTDVDIQGSPDPPYRIIVVAAGGAPAIPTDRMRVDDVVRLVRVGRRHGPARPHEGMV